MSVSQPLIDHEDIRTTLNHYAKTTPESLLNAAQVLINGVMNNENAEVSAG